MDGRDGVPPSQPGTVVCLQCGRKFRSLDRVRLRRCGACKRNPERLGKLHDHSFEIHGIAIPEAPEDRDWFH